MTADESEAAKEDLWLTYQNYDPAVKQAVRRLGALPGNNVEEFRALLLASRERKRLENRGLPDLILCLGLIHHLVIGGNIPLPEVVDWLASLSPEVILEFPSKKDPMVKALLRNKYDQYDDYSLPALEAALMSSGYQICHRMGLPSGERTLLYAVRKTSPAGAT